MPNVLDDLMQTASQHLAKLEYAKCEAVCVNVLRQSRERQDWDTYSRVLLPLQEARRQRRQAAIDGLCLLGAKPPTTGDICDELLSEPRLGCVVFTNDYTRKEVAHQQQYIDDQALAVEVLYVDSDRNAATWKVSTFRGPSAHADLPQPAEWLGQLVDPMKIKPPTPAHWFMRASEALGDVLLSQVTSPEGSVERLTALEEALAAAGDHEILHQRLADAARALHEARR